MVIRLTIRFFGGYYKLKCKCLSTKFKPIKNLFILLYRILQYERGCSIAWNSHFGGEPCLPHGLNGIFISGDAKIGRNCVIFHQVTIGSNTLKNSNRKGAPTIGNNCYIGAGAKLVGRITVGDNVRIGANCVVYKDVRDNSVVSSCRQESITKDKELNNRFYTVQKGQWVYFSDGKWIQDKEMGRAGRL